MLSAVVIRHRTAGVRLPRIHVGTDPGELFPYNICDIWILWCLSISSKVFSNVLTMESVMDRMEHIPNMFLFKCRIVR